MGVYSPAIMWFFHHFFDRAFQSSRSERRAHLFKPGVVVTDVAYQME
jgi:hypothetical protein